MRSTGSLVRRRFSPGTRSNAVFGTSTGSQHIIFSADREQEYPRLRLGILPATD